MAPRVPQKPRQAPKPSAPVRQPGQPAPPTDNMHGEEAERVQLISIVAKLSQADIAIEAAKVPLKAAQDARKKIVGLGKAAGFTAAELNKRLEEMQNPARDNPAKFAREERHRKWLGIINPEQAEMQLADKAPSDAKDEAHWKAEGYKAGLRQLPTNPPIECPERHVQAFMKEHERGYLETATANAPGQKGIREQAAKDFKDDNPEVDVAAAARKLKNSAFMERGAPEAEDPASIPEAPSTSSDPDQGFEATEEELAAQSTRQAVKDAAAGATSGEGGEVV